MSRRLATLRRARELHLERAHRFLDVPDWQALVLDAAGGDHELAADALELLDAVAPGEDCARMREGEEILRRCQRTLEARGEVPPEDPSLRFYGAGLTFSFWANGSAFFAEDSPEARWHGSRIYKLCERSTAEVAAMLGKACVLAEARAAAPKPWLMAAKAAETPAPAPVVSAGPPPRSSRLNGFTQDPEEGNE